MEEHQTFGQRRWPLHFALAWVLTRDPAFSERAKPSDFHPHLNEDEDDWISGDEVDQAWSLLHQALAGGSVPAFKTSKLCGNSDAGEASEERISPEALAGLDWADLTEHSNSSEVVLSSSAMIRKFTPGSDPIASTSDQAGPPIRPDGPGYMTLSAAAYWIATEGGTKRIVMRDVSVWKRAFAELLPYVRSHEVRVIGRRHGMKLHETIDGASFVELPVGYPYTPKPLPMIMVEEPHIRCCGVLFPETDGADQYSDELWGFNRHTPEWTHLQVLRLDIKECWPFSETACTKRGRKPGWDWEDIEMCVRKTLDERGDFDAALNRTQDWRSQNSLITLVQEYIEGLGEKAPSESILKKRLPSIVDGWRKEKLRPEVDEN